MIASFTFQLLMSVTFNQVPTEDDVEAPNAGSSLIVGDDKV